ncbi:hypothetical protein, partial [Escherichia coli]|uniref:hypothetical protein n=1 Tax=Escherichia coli TaxID=562 RepID=UPI0019547EE6
FHVIGERSSFDDGRSSPAEFDLKRSVIGSFRGDIVAGMWLRSPAAVRVPCQTYSPGGNHHAR